LEILLWGVSEDATWRVADHDAVTRLLAMLPPREAEVVACIDVVGLDVASTARALGIGPTAVRVAHHRALRRLRLVLQAPASGPSWPAPATE
jgi:RNA polymerase sigma-70 factor (ECF subfamily)